MTMTKTTSLMDCFFRFKIPRRWRLHRRGHSATTAHDTPKSDTPPTSVIETPKSDEPPTKTQLDYFFGPWSDPGEEEPQADAKVATEEITLPLEVYEALQTRLFKEQLNRTKIMALEEELKKTKWDLHLREISTRLYRSSLEEASEQLRELPNRGNTLSIRTFGEERLISDIVGNSQVTHKVAEKKAWNAC